MNQTIHIIPGGGDIDPAIYGEPRHAKLGVTNIAQDRRQLAEIDEAIAQKKPIIGICRGAQLLTVHQGGKLIQHIPYQGGDNPIIDNESQEIYLIPKAHHQVCVPKHEDTKRFRLLAFSYADKTFIPEVFYFPSINALAIQGHPEWLRDQDSGKETQEWLQRIAKKYLGVNVHSWRNYQ